VRIIGWIRVGDKASCGGTVVEGDPRCSGRGRSYAFLGARVVCREDCVIVEGFMRSRLPNGRARVHHGMVTSNGCPLQSTLNDIDGVGNESGKEIPPAFARSPDGGWMGIVPPEQEHGQAYDEYFIVVDEQTGAPVRDRFYRITLDSGETISGRTDDEGRTRYATSDRRRALTIEVAPAVEIQPD